MIPDPSPDIVVTRPACPRCAGETIWAVQQVLESECPKCALDLERARASIARKRGSPNG